MRFRQFIVLSDSNLIYVASVNMKYVNYKLATD